MKYNMSAERSSMDHTLELLRLCGHFSALGSRTRLAFSAMTWLAEFQFCQSGAAVSMMRSNPIQS